MAVNTTQLINDIKSLSEALDENIFIKKARASFKENIQDYEVADDEKVKMIATYEAQVSVGIMQEIIRTAKEMPELIAKEVSIKADSTLKAKQTSLVSHQICVEKGKALHIAEQIVSEKYRHRDLKAGTAIKIASIETTKQQAKFEEARRKIAIEANYQNAFMKKADFKVQEINALATDDDIVISAEQLTASKSAIEAIPTSKITYTSEVNINTPFMDSTTITSVPITCNT